MIAEFTLNIVFNIVSGMLGLLPDVSWSVETTAFEYFLDVIRVAGYLLPADTISAIIALIIVLLNFRIVIAIIRTIWDLLPIV